MKGLVRVLLLGLVALAAIASAGDQASPAGDIEDFVPSEKVSADEVVSFPVDI